MQVGYEALLQLEDLLLINLSRKTKVLRYFKIRLLLNNCKIAFLCFIFMVKLYICLLRLTFILCFSDLQLCLCGHEGRRRRKNFIWTRRLIQNNQWVSVLDHRALPVSASAAWHLAWTLHYRPNRACTRRALLAELGFASSARALALSSLLRLNEQLSGSLLNKKLGGGGHKSWEEATVRRRKYVVSSERRNDCQRGTLRRRGIAWTECKAGSCFSGLLQQKLINCRKGGGVKVRAGGAAGQKVMTVHHWRQNADDWKASD